MAPVSSPIAALHPVASVPSVAAPDATTVRALNERIRTLEAQLRDAQHAYRMLRTAAELFMHAGPSAVTWPTPHAPARPGRSTTGA